MKQEATDEMCDCTQALRKNFTIKMRNARDLVVEILMPCLFVFLLTALVSSSSKSTLVPASEAPDVTPMASAQEATLAIEQNGRLFYAPSTSINGTSEVDRIMRAFSARLQSATARSRLVASTSEDAILAVYNSLQGVVVPSVAQAFYAAIVFPAPDPITGRLPADLSIRIRINGSDVPDTAVVARPSQWRSFGGELNDASFTYEDSGFLALQSLLSQSVMDVRAGPTANTQLAFAAASFPYAEWVSKDSSFILNLAPLFIVLGFINVVGKTAGAMVAEKETRTKEAMAMMGLAPSAWWMSWWLTTAASVTASALFITGLAVARSLILYTSPVLFFALIWAYALSLIMFVSMIINFFDKSKNAQQAGAAFGID